MRGRGPTLASGRSATLVSIESAGIAEIFPTTIYPVYARLNLARTSIPPIALLSNLVTPTSSQFARCAARPSIASEGRDANAIGEAHARLHQCLPIVCGQPNANLLSAQAGRYNCDYEITTGASWPTRV